MRDSSLYQGILQDGRSEGEVAALRRALRRQGTQRFGAPRIEDESALMNIGDVGRLDRMIDRVLTATDWNDLLNTP